jgi:hypothetical protein
MNFEVKANVPILLLFLFGAALLVLAHALFPVYRPSIEFGASLLGGSAAVYALLLNVQARRASSASLYIQRYNDPGFSDMRKELSATLKDSSQVTDEHARGAMLNFFEELSLAVNNKQADEVIVRGFFYSISGKYYRALTPWISNVRNKSNQPTAYVEFERLYKRWNSQP